MKVTIQPGDCLDIEIEGLGVMYSVVSETHGDHTFVTVIDRANDTVIDQNIHPVD